MCFVTPNKAFFHTYDKSRTASGPDDPPEPVVSVLKFGDVGWLKWIVRLSDEKYKFVVGSYGRVRICEF